MEWLQQLINGISLGSIYALIALGYTMVYGIIKLINFAHGEVFMVGAFIGFYPITYLELSFFPALIISDGNLCDYLGLLIERIAYKRLRECDENCRFNYCNWYVTIHPICIYLHKRCRARSISSRCITESYI